MNPKIPYPKGNFLKMFRSFSFLFTGEDILLPPGRLQTMYFRKHFGHQLGKQMVTCAGPMGFAVMGFWRGPKRRKHPIQPKTKLD